LHRNDSPKSGLLPVIGVLAATNGTVSARDSTQPDQKTRVLTNGSKIFFKDEINTGEGVKFARV
jgi:hypothetical protein